MKRSDFFLIAVLAVSAPVTGSQTIPVGTVAISVGHVSFDRAVQVLAASGYHIDSLDRKRGMAKTAYKLVPNSIEHLSIAVRTTGDAVVISGDWWSSLAPPGKDRATIMRVEVDGYQPMYELFGVIDSYAKSLKGPVTYIKSPLH